MKEVEEANSEIGLEEQNYLLRTWKDLKDSIFNVLFVMLDKDDDDEEQQTMYGIAFESGVDYLQMLAFPFDASIIAVWNGGDTLEKVFEVFSKFNISTYLPGVSFSTFLILLYALIFLIILVLLDIIYVSYSFSKKKFRFTWPLVILAQLVPLFVTILFLPITETLLSVVRCKTQEGLGYQVMISFPDIVCWRGWHLFHAAITLLFSSLFVFISSVVALALFEPRMATKKLTARQNSTGEIVFIMNKIICQLVFSFNPFEEKWVYSVMLFCLSGWLYWTYNMNDPFYNKKASKFFRIVSSYYFWTNFMLLVSQILSPLGFSGGLVIWISGLPFIGIIIYFEHKENIDQLFSSNLKFKSGLELESHLVYVLQLIRNQDQDKNTYMLMAGYIEKHKQICVEDDCPFKSKKKRHRTMTEKEDLTEKLLKQLERMYKLGIKKYPNCTRLRLSFSFFQLERLENKNRAYEELTYAQKTDPTFEEEFIIYRFKKIIRENLENAGEQSTTDLIELIRFENHISLCEEAMLQSARLHKQFWIQLKEQTPDLKRLNVLGSRITKTAKTVRQNYTEIQKINSSVPEVLYCYAIYQTLVANEVAEGKSLFETAQKIYSEKINMNEKNQESKESNDCESQIENCEFATLIVSAKASSVGKIMNTNLLFTELTGYFRKQIIQRNIDKVMPEILCCNSIHEEKMQNWVHEKDISEFEVNCTNSEYIGQKRQGYIKDKSGFIIHVDYKVHYCHSTESFIVNFKTLSDEQNYCHFTLDCNGVIKDGSYMSHLFFGMDKAGIGEQETDVEEFLGINKIDELYEKNKKSPFEHQIRFNETLIETDLVISPLVMSLKLELMEESEVGEESGLIQKKEENKIIGFYLKVLIKGLTIEKINAIKEYRENKFKPQLLSLQYEARDNESQNKETQEMNISLEEEVKENILNLYEEPNLMDILISSLAEQKSTVMKPELYELNVKIKTMRLLNNEIKMVYDQNSNADFERGDSDANDEDEYEQIKLNDESYHQKIRFAINTKLNHIEVKKLKILAFVFVLIIMGLTIGQLLINLIALEENSIKGDHIYKKAREGNFLMKGLIASLDPTLNQSQILGELKSHSVEFESPLVVNISLGDGKRIEKNLTDSFSFFYSHLQQYFISGGIEDIGNLYDNFVNVMYENIERIYFSPTPYWLITIIQGISSLFLCCIFLLLWIYIVLNIEKKKIDILLWFLDIPISYVSYLGDHCDSYLKNFLTIKDTMKKGLPTQDTHLYFQDYMDNKGKQNEVEEQQKTRKSLIMKQKKQTLISRIDCSYNKMLWIILFGTTYSIICLISMENIENYYTFLQEQWFFSARSLLYANSISLASYLLSQNLTVVGGKDMRAFRQENQNQFLNSLNTQEDLLSFNEYLLNLESDADYEELAQIYVKVYFTDICLLLQAPPQTNCTLLAHSSLRGGYRIYSVEISSNITNQEDLREANEKYASQALLLLLKQWRDILAKKVEGAVTICSITFYIFTFVGIIGFLVGWLLYLSKINTEINEAISMLNMIPFKLLSNARKETKEFIIWIIREANAKEHNMK